MLDAEHSQRFGIAVRTEADAIVGHDAIDFDTMASKEAQGVEKKSEAGLPRFIGENF